VGVFGGATGVCGCFVYESVFESYVGCVEKSWRSGSGEEELGGGGLLRGRSKAGEGIFCRDYGKYNYPSPLKLT
jgi:hypothetical protein